MFPYLQIPEIAFFLIASLSSPILLNKMSNVSSVGNSEIAKIAAAATLVFDDSILSLIASNTT